MTKLWVPGGKIPTKDRDFDAVVADVRHTVFSVHRHRPTGNGLFDVTPLGSGFFVSPEAFVTCWHVIDQPGSPHQPGDVYRLVNNLDGTHGIIHEINGGVGKDIHLYPDLDFAILISKSKQDQAFLPLSYADIPVGRDIGVAGYPLAVIYGCQRSSNAWRSGISRRAQHDRMILEVNFIFVPGNSGGPIFDARTGRATAYVKGFRTHKIADRTEQCNLVPVPAGLNQTYLAAVHAVYSIGLTFEPVRNYLEQFGAQL